MRSTTSSFALPTSRQLAISIGACLQDARNAPEIVRDTVPGSGNFCLLTQTPMAAVIAHLEREGIAIAAGPGKRAGATGPILSVYFRDPDGNLVEVSNLI